MGTEEEDEQRKPLVKKRKSETDYGGIKSRSSSESSTSDSKTDKSKNKKKKSTSVSLCTLFRYSDKLDKMLMILGSFFAVVQGAGWPLLAIVFGEMTNTFISQEAPEAIDPFGSNPQPNTNGTLETQGYLRMNITNNDVVDIPIYQAAEPSQVTDIFGNLSPQMFETQMTAFALYYVYIGLVVFAAAMLQIYCWQVSCERQVYKIRQEFFYQVLRQEIGWFDKHQSGELSMKLNDDLERIREGIGDKFSMLIQHTATFFAGFLVGFLKGWELTLVIMSMSPLVALTSAYMGKIVASSTAREQAKYALAGSVAEEVLGNIRTVTSFSGQLREIKRYTEALTQGRDIAMRKYINMGIGMGLTFIILYGTYALAFWYGSELILAKKMDPGGVFTVFFSVMIGSFSLGNAAPHLSAVATAMGSAVTIFEILDMKPKIDPYSDKGLMLDADNFRADIEFNDVRFNYPTRKSVPILRGLSIRIREGQTVALCGASGSGKSTVIGLLLRFYDPLSGKIRINGQNLKRLNVRWLRTVIGVVSQEPVLFGSTIKENIQYGRQDVTFSEVVEAAKMANAHDFIAALPKAYDTLVGDRGAQLSGGQKQRIAIARALVRDPKILLLDEATSALDSESEAIVQQALDKAREGRTTIIVAHRLSTIKNADVIYAMEDGQVMEYGSHEELMDMEGLYHNLVMNQMFVDETGYSTAEGAISDNDLVMRKRGRSTSVLTQPSILDTTKEREFYRLTSNVPEEEVPLPSAFKILRFANKEWKEITLGSFASIITGATMPAFAVFYSEMFNTFTLVGEELKDAAFFWSMMFLVLAGATGIGNFLRMLGFGFSGEKLTMRLRQDAFTNIVRQDVAWFDEDKHSSGKIATRLATDVPMVKTAAGHRVGILISAVVTLGTSIVIAFIFGWKLALALTAAVPILLAAGAVEMRIMKGNQIRDAELMADAGRVVTECLENIRTVQSLTQEPLFLMKFIHHLDLPFTENKKHAFVYGLAFAFSQGVIFFIYAAAFRFGAYLIGNNEMIATDVYRVFFAMAFSAVSVGQWTSYLPDYTKAQLSAGLVFQVIETEPAIDAFSNGGIQPRISGEVTFSDVHFKYPSRSNVPILRGLNFTVSPGQTLALIGPSGCGKSTCISLIQRFYDPDRGTVKVDDFDIRTINLAHLRKHVAVVSQEPVLFNCTIGENIIYGVEGQVTQKEIENAASLANIHDFIMGLPKRYDTMVGERGAQLSGGQKQRIAIARALVRDPRILLLDEATSALDTESEKVVQEALDKASKGRTCIVVAHRLSTIQNADCIAVVDKGTIVEKGKHEELIKKKGVYYKLTKRQRITH